MAMTPSPPPPSPPQPKRVAQPNPKALSEELLQISRRLTAISGEITWLKSDDDD